MTRCWRAGGGAAEWTHTTLATPPTSHRGWAGQTWTRWAG